jgi:uncharacterized membrane protein/plastocyanin
MLVHRPLLMNGSLGGPLLLGIAGAVLFSPSLSATSQSRATTPQKTVVIKQMHFDPPHLQARVDERIEWKNEDIYTHTVSANDGSFDSGPILPGKTWDLTLKRTGTVGYHCRPHPNMIGDLEVSEGGAKNTAPEGGERASLKWRPPNSPEELHPILVNFTAALLPLAFLSDLLGRILRRQSLHNAAWWMVLYAAAITPLTVAAGWWWRHAAGPDLPARLITVHQWLGTAAAILFIILAVWRWTIYKRETQPTLGYLTFAFVTVLALIYQGSLGGRMVFGK